MSDAKPTSEPRYPVVAAIVSWNTRDLLARCLSSFEGDHSEGRVDVHVVDNESSDGSPAMVRERFPWVRLIEPGTNLGFGPAVNLVAERTRSPWIMPANADIALTPGALPSLMSVGEKAPGAGAVAPRLILPDGSTQHSVYAFPTIPLTAAVNLGNAVARLVGDHLCLEGYWDPERARTVDWAIGAALLVRRRAWEEAGGFDEEQWMYAEDLDLGWRLGRAGWRTLYVPDARVMHESEASTRQTWDDAASRWIVSTYAWMMRRRGGLRTRIVAALNFGAACARWLAYAALARVRPGRWAARRDAMRRWASLHRAGFRARRRLVAHR